MERTVLIVEPDPSQGKQIARILILAGYDAITTSSADEALRQLYEVHPDAVILSDRLPVDELNRLSNRITMMSDLPLIGLGSDIPLASVTQQLARSTVWWELPRTLNDLLKPNLPTGKNESPTF